MPSFKPKTNKKITVDVKNSVTLDNKHNEIMTNFTINESLIEELETKKKDIQLRINEQKNEINSNPGKILENQKIYNDLKEINKKIKKIRNEKKKYLLNNAKSIFTYFEEKKNISNNDDGNTNSKKLNDFFKIKPKKNELEQEDDNNVNIVKKYLANVDETFVDLNNYIVSHQICEYCHKGEYIPVDEEGLLICNSCSRFVHYLIENEKPSYKEPPKEVCFYAYKRINHFREILAQFQAKETTQIPDKVIDDIKNQIKKERIELKHITNNKAKEILKKLGYNKYYEHIPFIKDMIGIKPPVMTPELEETLCNLFMEIQRPYAKFCPDDRVNFLNYYYTVYKLCELLDQKQFLPFFPMLKDREKRIEQDNIWKQICDELNWEFIPTI